VRQFSKLVVSATHPNFLAIIQGLCLIACAKLAFFSKTPNIWCDFSSYDYDKRFDEKNRG
ncbi:MAG: hypothetical protein ACI4V2_08965, partial [Alloprevotella sp.]